MRLCRKSGDGSATRKKKKWEENALRMRRSKEFQRERKLKNVREREGE